MEEENSLVISDSEPEREATQSRERVPASVTAAYGNHFDVVPTGTHGMEHQGSEVASTSISTSQYFPPPSQESKPRKRRTPPTSSDSPLKPPPPLLLNSTSGPSTSSHSERSRSPSSLSNLESIKPRPLRKPKIRKKPTSQFQSAASLLLHSPHLARSEEEEEEKPKSSPYLKKERKKRVTRPKFTPVAILADSSMEIMESVIPEVKMDDLEEEDFWKPPPPRMHADDLARIIYGLPPLIRTPATTTTTTTTTSGRRKKPWEMTEEENQSDDKDATAAERLRGGLTKYKYVVDPSTSLPSRSKSVPETLPSGAGDLSKEMILPVRSTSVSSTFLTDQKAPIPVIELPHNDRIRVLLGCPLCKIAWTTKKTLKTKSTHLRNCAMTNDYTSRTVQVLTEDYILTESLVVERTRREEEKKRNLFDLTIGIGEGRAGWRTVSVVGVGEENQGRDKVKISDLQKELDAATRKVPLDKITVLAREIRSARFRKAELEATRLRIKAKEAQEKGNDMEVEESEDDKGEEEGEVYPLPRATGLLIPVSTNRRKAIASRAAIVLGGLGGSGLTQSVTTPYDKSTTTSSLLPSAAKFESNTVVLSDSDIEMAPPSTQTFEPSKVAQHLVEQGSLESIVLSNKGKLEMLSRKGDSPVLDTPVTSSLWEAANCRDSTALQRVVHISSSPSPSSSSFSSSTPPRNKSNNKTPLRSGSIVESPHYSSSEWSGSPIKLIVSDGVMEEEMKILGLGFEGNDVDGRGRREEEEAGWSAGEGEGGEEGVLRRTGRESEGAEEMIIIEDLSSEDELFESKSKVSKGKERATESTITSTPKKSTTSKAISPSPSPSSSDSEPLCNIPSPLKPQNLPPDYSSWTTPVLKKEVAKYGFRISKERSVLIDQLNAVWLAINAPKPIVQPKKKKKEEVVPVENLGERVRSMIMKDQELYIRVLRYEPIFFEEFVTRAAESGIKCAKPLLMRCLDELCITIYTQDPTGPPRSRHR